MKTLTKYLNEKLIIFPSQVNEKLVIFPSQVDEKLVINKDYKDAHAYTCTPKSFEELRKIIEDRYNKLGPGTNDKPIDFNDVDVSNIDSFYNKYYDISIFNEIKFEYIDISDWDVSNIKSMRGMFGDSRELESVGDLSSWDVSNVIVMSYMFAWCESFNQDLSSWDVSSVTRMSRMFSGCHSFNKDISNWNVSNVMNWMYRMSMFDGCPIKNEYKPKFK